MTEFLHFALSPYEQSSSSITRQLAISAKEFSEKNDPLNFKLRIHHLDFIETLIAEWNKKNMIKPGEMTDKEELGKMSFYISNLWAEQIVGGFGDGLKIAIKVINERDNDPDEIKNDPDNLKLNNYFRRRFEYYQEIIGENGNKADAVKQGYAVFGLNFLLASSDSRSVVILSSNPDGICGSCQGEGIGMHCLDPKEEKAESPIFSRATEYLKSYNLPVNNGEKDCISFSIQILWTSDFIKYVMDE